MLRGACNPASQRQIITSDILEHSQPQPHHLPATPRQSHTVLNEANSPHDYQGATYGISKPPPYTDVQQRVEKQVVAENSQKDDQPEIFDSEQQTESASLQETPYQQCVTKELSAKRQTKVQLPHHKEEHKQRETRETESTQRDQRNQAAAFPLTDVYRECSNALDQLPDFAHRFLDRVTTRIIDQSVNASNSVALRVFSEMSSISSRGPSSLSENDLRMRNNRVCGSMVTQQDTPPPSPAGSTDRHSGSRACCFCWCCCCSCSCLTVKNGENTNQLPQQSNRDNDNESDEPPTAEEIISWGESFERLMYSHGGRKVFREFLKSEYSEENMLFWLACEDLKRTDNPEMVEEKARLIYEDYISILSPKEVSLDARVREIINKNMVEPSPHTFDEAQLQIFTLMHRDSYLRFLKSSIYKKLLQKHQS